MGVIANKVPATPASLIRIGRLTGVHGLRGGLRFRPDYPESESIESVERIFLSDSEADTASATEAQEYRISDLAPLGRGTIRLMLEGITDANLAELLRGKNVFADEADLPAPAENEFYFRDVIGCEVVLLDGRRIGIVEDIIATGANDVFVVRGDGKEVLVPAIEDVVKEIDVEGKRVLIDAVPGLLD